MASTALHPGRRGLALAAVIAVVVVGSVLLGGLVLIENDFRPEGGPFGLPTRILACGEWFERAPGDTRVMTMAEVEGASTPSQPPIVFEPTIGQVPLLGPLEYAGTNTCGLRVYLHVGPDQYVEYAARP